MLGLRTPLALMRLVAKAGLNAVGFGVAGDFALEVLPGIAHDVYKGWAKDKPPPEAAAEVQATAQLSPEQAHQLAVEAVAAEAAGQPAAKQKLLTQYLEAIPQSIRQSLRRQEDPGGKSVAAGFAVQSHAAVMCLLPARLPRFQPGEAPPSLHGWSLVKLLGAGGFGEVWLARHPQARNIFAAVKFCLDPKARDGLLHEKHVIDQVMSLGTLPTIVPLLDFDLESDPPYLKYQFIPGGDLLEFATHFQGIKATAAMHHLAKTVGRFHRLRPPVVHRDLKPSNILVEKAARDGGSVTLHLRVADFGIGGTALMIDQERVRTMPSAVLPTALLGSHTALYASKQQKRGAKPDPRDDVFALGVLWYQLLIGDLICERPAGRSWKRRVAALGLSESLIDLLECCCDDEPEARPDDAADLAEKIAAASRTAEPAPPPPPATSRAEVSAPAPARAQRPVAPPSPPPRPTPSEPVARFTNSLLMPFVLVSAGAFWMGGGGGTCGDRQVTIAKPFYMGAYPVTQAQWQVVMGNNPSYFDRSKGGGPDHPVEQVSWEDVQVFLEKLNAREQGSGLFYCLPTEAGWEYSCRGGPSSQADCSYHFYLDRPSNSLSSTQANFDGNYPEGRAATGPYLERTSKVGSYQPNRLGIYDLHGNVWEWCQDLYEKGPGRVVRGGGWILNGSFCQAASRGWYAPSNRRRDLGCRLVAVPSSAR